MWDVITGPYLSFSSNFAKSPLKLEPRWVLNPMGVRRCNRRKLGASLRWWPPSILWAGPLIFFMATIGAVWIIPSFRIWSYVLYVEHISCVITNCGQHQWAISSLFSIVREENITGRKHNQKITIALFRFVLQNFTIAGCFPYILFYRFSPDVFVVVCYCSMWLCFSQETS